MESEIVDFLKKWWWAILGAVIALVLVVSWLNTPHQDSTEKPKPKVWEKKTQHTIDSLVNANAILKAQVDTALYHSQQDYDAGVQYAKEAMDLRKETHQKPKPQHEKVSPTPATVKQLQEYYDNF